MLKEHSEEMTEIYGVKKKVSNYKIAIILFFGIMASRNRIKRNN